MKTFKYPSRLLSCYDSDWPVVAGNLWKLRWKWVRFSRILIREGADPCTSGYFYVTVVQSVLMFGSETWVVMSCTLWEMGGLYNWSARHISGRMPQRLHSEVWDYPPIGEGLADVVLEKIGICVTHGQNTLAQYISTWKIFNIKLAE